MRFDGYHIGLAAHPEEFHAFVKAHFPQAFSQHDRVARTPMLPEQERSTTKKHQ
jgi:hypothetical protein